MISGGVSKSGFPCPRFSALYCCASIFTSVKTVVPNVATRRAEVGMGNTPSGGSRGTWRRQSQSLSDMGSSRLPAALILNNTDNRAYYTYLHNLRTSPSYRLSGKTCSQETVEKRWVMYKRREM